MCPSPDPQGPPQQMGAGARRGIRYTADDQGTAIALVSAEALECRGEGHGPE